MVGLEMVKQVHNECRMFDAVQRQFPPYRIAAHWRSWWKFSSLRRCSGQRHPYKLRTWVLDRSVQSCKDYSRPCARSQRWRLCQRKRWTPGRFWRVPGHLTSLMGSDRCGLPACCVRVDIKLLSWSASLAVDPPGLRLPNKPVRVGEFLSSWRNRTLRFRNQAVT